jgi:hypothetical protein
MLIAALAALSAAKPGFAAEDAYHRCVNTDANADHGGARLIEILFSNLRAGQPCKVIYRPESESDALGTVAWQDLGSADVCKGKANEIVSQLIDDGWSCTLTRKAEATVTLTIPEQAVPGQEASLRSADEIDRRTNLGVYPDLVQPSDELLALIEADLNRLEARLDGSLQAMISGYGDLNDDGIEDVLVLFSYQSPKPAYRQFLAVYMHDGEAFRLTATKPIGSYANDTTDAKVNAIERGVVYLTLQSFEPGDASCCPSGEYPLALALRDLEFVEIDADAPTR